MEVIIAEFPPNRYDICRLASKYQKLVGHGIHVPQSAQMTRTNRPNLHNNLFPSVIDDAAHIFNCRLLTVILESSNNCCTLKCFLLFLQTFC